MKLARKIENITDYNFCDEELVYQQGKKILVNSVNKMNLPADFFGEFYCHGDFLIIQSFLGQIHLFKNFKQVFSAKGFYNPANTSELTFLNTEINQIQKYSNNQLQNQPVKESYCKIGDHLFVQTNEKITYCEDESFNKLWRFDVSDLGTFINEDGKEKSYEIEKFIGIYNDQELMTACNGRLIISLDIETGELKRKWQELPGFGSDTFGGVIKDKIPPARGFQLNTAKNQLYSLAGHFMVKIDLDSGEFKFENLKAQLESKHIDNLRYSSGYAEDETHCYTIGEMNQEHFGTDYIPQCILSINKKTHEVDWLYRFEDDGVKTDIPKLNQNKLYQLTSSGTLHIFERE